MKYITLIIFGLLLLAGCSSPKPEPVVGLRNDGVITEDGKPVVVEMPNGEKAVVTSE